MLSRVQAPSWRSTSNSLSEAVLAQLLHSDTWDAEDEGDSENDGGGDSKDYSIARTDKLQLTGDREGQKTDPLPFTSPAHAHIKTTHSPFCHFRQVQQRYVKSAASVLLRKTLSPVNFYK